MNLINDKWIPVRRADGRLDIIAPWQITDHIGTDQSPIVAIASPRPDFDGALVQFLIGLLQTTCTPEDENGWWDWREEPPPPERLKDRFATVGSAFEVEGQPAFMQDFLPDELKNELNISALLIETPGDQALEHNKDHFIKRGSVEQLCPACAVTALLTMQINAPAGGRGYRTSLRGGGPLTTLVLGNTLWETCWFNILQSSTYHGDEQPTNSLNHHRFPWLAPTRTSEAKPPAGITTPVDVHPDHIFWASPRRIRLKMDDVPETGSCSLCANTSQRLCRTFTTTNYGPNYQGFEHTLSPHYSNNDGKSPVHPQPGGMGYRHWLGLIENSTEGNIDRQPAKVIEQFRSRVQEEGRLWAFGYDMDNMKARCWYDATLPILTAPEGMAEIFKAQVEKLVQAAHRVCSLIRSRVKHALFGDSDVRGDLSYVQSHFWSVTEGSFYEHIRSLRDVLASNDSGNTILESWLTTLKNTALTLFDHYSRIGDFDVVDPRRIAAARNSLGKDLNGKKIRDILGLPKPEHHVSKQKRKTT